MYSGLSTGYSASQVDALRYESIGGAGVAHPFASLKVLYNTLGATNEIPLGKTTSTYEVDFQIFVNTQYPISSTNPTRTVTTSEDSTYTSRDVVAWVAVVYALLLVFFIVLAVGFIYHMQQAKAN